MAATRVLCDTGPLLAFLNGSDQWHEWAASQFAAQNGPLHTCEAVLSETIFLLQDAGLDVQPLLELVQREALRIDFLAAEHWPDVCRLLSKYSDQPMSFADACLVRMSELHEPCQVFTTDGDFKVYRRHGRKLIPVLAPWV